MPRELGRWICSQALLTVILPLPSSYLRFGDRRDGQAVSLVERGSVRAPWRGSMARLVLEIVGTETAWTASWALGADKLGSPIPLDQRQVRELTALARQFGALSGRSAGDGTLIK